MQEPSVLDYILSRLSFGRKPAIVLPETLDEPADAARTGEEFPPVEPETGGETTPAQPAMAATVQPAPRKLALPGQVFASLALAVIAQTALEPPDPNIIIGVGLYALALLALAWGILTYPEVIRPVEAEAPGEISLRARMIPFVLSLVVSLLVLLTFGRGVFNPTNLTLWALALFYLFWGLWEGKGSPRPLAQRVRAWFRRPEWSLRLSRWGVLVALALLVVVFFRFYQIDQVPGDMFSDHAEKLLDVADVLDGQLNVFFPRNTGREFFQFYLTAAIAKIFGTGLSFISLKIGTVLAGLFAVPFIYLLGKELGGRWVGLFALLLAGFAYWPNVISRVGLRFPLYPMFAAPALYFLVRGLRNQRRNDFLLAGLALGFGLHGYSAARILPFVAVAAVAIYLLHGSSKGRRVQTLWATLEMALVAIVIFLPLFRYALDHPNDFGYRMLTRMGSAERPLPGPALQIFLNNLWNSLIMPFWKNGDIWVHSVTGRPALDVITAALFFIGLVVVFVRYVRHRNWVDLFLLLSIPLLMLPSILSLAFPEENPSLNRSGGAIVPVFIIAAFGLTAVLRVIAERMGPRWGKSAAALTALLLLGYAMLANYDLVFNQYRRQFDLSVWNTAEIGRVVRGFADSIGSSDTAYVIPYPYWVDTRLVGINAGYPRLDTAIQPENIAATSSDVRTKLFILNINDQEHLEQLIDLYPNGILTRHQNDLTRDKDFFVFLVPGVSGDQP